MSPDPGSAIPAPLPRWTTLPGDPPALRGWLADQRGDRRSDEADGDWPQEEPPVIAVDDAKRNAINACGRPGCGQPEEAHQNRTGTDPGDLALFAALGGACGHFVASDAAVILQKYLAITDNRAPRYQPGTGRIGKRLPLHKACGHRHQPGSCPFQSGAAPGPDTAARGIAKAREALGLTRPDESEEAS